MYFWEGCLSHHRASRSSGPTYSFEDTAPCNSLSSSNPPSPIYPSGFDSGCHLLQEALSDFYFYTPCFNTELFSRTPIASLPAYIITLVTLYGYCLSLLGGPDYDSHPLENRHLTSPTHLCIFGPKHIDWQKVALSKHLWDEWMSPLLPSEGTFSTTYPFSHSPGALLTTGFFLSTYPRASRSHLSKSQKYHMWPPCWLQSSFSGPSPRPPLLHSPASLLHSWPVSPTCQKVPPPHHRKCLASVTRELEIPKVLSSWFLGSQSPSSFLSLHNLASLVHLRLPSNAVFPRAPSFLLMDVLPQSHPGLWLQLPNRNQCLSHLPPALLTSKSNCPIMTIPAPRKPWWHIWINMPQIKFTMLLCKTPLSFRLFKNPALCISLGCSGL